MMKPTGSTLPLNAEWNSSESLRLLQLLSSENDWSLYAGKLAKEFGTTRKTDFFTAQSCKCEFDRILLTGHPEHFIRRKGEKYSQKDLIAAWITYLQKQAQEEKDRESELLMVKLREKADLFNRLFADDCDMTEEEMSRQLEQARLELGEYDHDEFNRQFMEGLKKLSELEQLHKSNPEKYPPLRIEIPPPTRDAAATSSFSPIKPLFEGLIPPPGALAAAALTPPQQDHPEPSSSGMSLRSSAASPPKTVAPCSPQKTSKSLPSTPQKSAGAQTRSGLKDSQQSGSSKSSAASSPRVQKASPVGRGQRSPPLASPTAALRSSPRHALSTSNREAGEEQPKVKEEEPHETAAEDTPIVAEIPAASVSADADTTTESVVEMKKNESEKEADISTETGDSQAGVTEGPNEAEEAPKEKQPSEKRLLRAHKESQGSTETPTMRSSRRLQRGSARRSAAEHGTKGDNETEKTDKPTLGGHELRARRSSAASGATGSGGESTLTTPVKAAGPQVSLRPRRGTDKSDETADEGGTHHRRRSERRREAATSSSDTTPPVNLKRKWSVVVAEIADGTPAGDASTDDDDNLKLASLKRRRLVFPVPESSGTVENAEREAADGAEKAAVVSSVTEVQSSPEQETGGLEPSEAVPGGAAGTKKENEPAAGKDVPGKVASRRGSLRRAATAADAEHGGKQHAAAEQPAIAKHKEATAAKVVHHRLSDSDEEKTLGDIRERHRAARASASADGGGPTKKEAKKDSGGEESPGVVHEAVHATPNVASGGGRRFRKAGLSKIRGRLQRSRVFGKDAAESPPKQPGGPIRRFTKKERMDENALGQRALLLNTWRMVSSHRHAAIFAHPVQDKDAFEYSTTVKSRMDLSTLKKQIDTGEVRDITEFKRRLLLMFANAVMFNSTGHDVNIYAKEMATDTLKDLRDMEKNILHVKGSSTHITRRSAASAAEVALVERRKTTGHRGTAAAVSAEQKDEETVTPKEEPQEAAALPPQDGTTSQQQKSQQNSSTGKKTAQK